MRIITISGLDGSGKSTQIEILKKHLLSQGDRKIFYFHAIEFGIAKKINDFRLKYCIICRYLHKCKQREKLPQSSVTKANLPQTILRRIFLMIDLLRFRSLCSKLRNDGFDYLVSDRYFYDSVINIRYLAKSGRALPCEKFIPKPDLAIYLDADPEKIMRRERKPDQGLAYLQKKKDLYDKAYAAWGLKIIDGNGDKEKISADIKFLIF